MSQYELNRKTGTKKLISRVAPGINIKNKNLQAGDTDRSG